MATKEKDAIKIISVRIIISDDESDIEINNKNETSQVKNNFLRLRH